MQTNIRVCTYLTQFFLEMEMLLTKVVENRNTHFVFKTSFSKNVSLMRLSGNILQYQADHT